MRELKMEEMELVDGGAANPILITTIVTMVVTFLVGVLYGYSDPKRCN